MRLWTIHPKYLDTKGIVALWREGLLAKAVLENKTKGYKNHPQLNRFRNSINPVKCIEFYLHVVCDVANERGYCFDRSKLGTKKKLKHSMRATSGQVRYEWTHLLKKLKVRSPGEFKNLKSISRPRLHPIFYSKNGPIEDWEIIIKV